MWRDGTKVRGMTKIREIVKGGIRKRWLEKLIVVGWIWVVNVQDRALCSGNGQGQRQWKTEGESLLWLSRLLSKAQWRSDVVRSWISLKPLHRLTRVLPTLTPSTEDPWMRESTSPHAKTCRQIQRVVMKQEKVQGRECYQFDIPPGVTAASGLPSRHPLLLTMIWPRDRVMGQG